MSKLQKHIIIYVFIIIHISACSLESSKQNLLVDDNLFLPVQKKNLKGKNSITIAFGSCFKQNESLKIFDAIKEEEIDLFLMIGDNVYGNSTNKNLSKLRRAYKKQKQNFKRLNLNFPIEAI